MIQSRTRVRPSQPLKWHGGKSYLANHIVSMIPHHIHYVEPFFGGGAVFFRKPTEMIIDHSEVVNDLFGDLINFWSVLASPQEFEEFERRAASTPFSKPAWEKAVNDATGGTDVDRALAFFIRFRQSRQGLGRDFATMSRSRTRRGMNEQASSWWSAVEGLADAHERLKRVVIFNEPAIKVIAREDSANTLFYCDPPYLAETRVVSSAYNVEMTYRDHQELLDLLARIKGKFILSGYPHSLYGAAAERFGWNQAKIQIDNKASGQKTKPTKTECLWTNF